MSDWWSKKLKGEPASTPQRSLPTTGFRINTVPQTQQTQQTQTVTAHNQSVLDPNRPPTEQISMSDAIRLWKGGEAHRKEGDMRCPECGSQHVFKRVGRGANTSINGAAPAPRCFECGWNGKFSQADQGNWAS